jgi:hypothetical protein
MGTELSGGARQGDIAIPCSLIALGMRRRCIWLDGMQVQITSIYPLLRVRLMSLELLREIDTSIEAVSR